MTVRPPLPSHPHPPQIDVEPYIDNRKTGVPPWAVAAGAAIIAALVTGMWGILRAEVTETEARLSKVEARAADDRSDIARRGAQLDALDKTLVRMDARLDKIDSHLETLTTAVAAQPQRAR